MVADTATSEVEPKPTSAPAPSATESPSQPEPEGTLARLLRLCRADTPEDELSAAVHAITAEVLGKHAAVTDKYNVVVLFDDSSLVRADADKVYTAVTSLQAKKPLLLIIQSSGGRIEPAYLISRLCRKYAAGRFIVAVPRSAKSAATLICCGADEIHMGSMSELGPIDPQIKGLPTLGLKNAVQHVAELVRANPAASEMFASYLAKSLNLSQLGYYERVAESAAQYAERLLLKRAIGTSKTPSDIAQRLVYHYRDHGFVIDADEAKDIFGAEVIKNDTPEYALSNDLYQMLDFIKYVFEYHKKHDFYFIGTPINGCNLLAAQKRE